MEPIYLDLHIHTSEDENNPNKEYDVCTLLKNIKETNYNSKFLISLTDHNMINKSAYLKLLKETKDIILGVELHIWNSLEKPPYHCHIYFDLEEISEEKIDDINDILDLLYPNKKIQPPYSKKINIEDVIRSFDKYDFLLLPHGGQSHSTFDKSVDTHFDTRLEKSLYYNQFDGFTARNEKGLEETISYFEKLGINEFINLITCTDNYNPVKYPEAKAKDASPFIPTWMLAESTFNGLRLSLSEHSRLLYSIEKPDLWSEYLKSVKLENDYIDMDVKLTSGLNVIIGDSSSGKTLFVDTIVSKSLNDFSKSNYLDFGVEDVQIDNPSGCIPHYINQNYIIELIANNKNEIEKIDIIKKVFPDAEDVKNRIGSGLLKLKQDIDSLITYVENIEIAEQEISKIPILNRLIQNSEVKENIVELLQPSSTLIEKLNYPKSVYENHINHLDEIDIFMKKNEFIEYDESEIQVLKEKLVKGFLVSSLEQKIRKEINNGKINLDTFFLETNKETQQKKDNFSKLIDAIQRYINNLNNFKNKLQEIQNYNLSIQSSEIESMGHNLSIEYTFKLNRNIFLETINQFLKSEHKIDTLDELKHNELYLANYKDRPRIDGYEEFKSKVYIEFEKMNKRKYKIVTKDGRDFDSLSAGWKTSILLDLILGYDGDSAPLIIDQPEDNLANSYINKGLIESIKKIKNHKQIIIVSHNATIPMLGDAQNIILCTNDGKIKILSNPLEGKIEGKSVVDYIATITDGGKTSIRKRVKKYNMKKFEEVV